MWQRQRRRTRRWNVAVPWEWRAARPAGGHNRRLREAVRYPALLSVTNDLSESDAYTLMTIGVQAILLSAKEIDNKTKQRINDLRELLEKIHQEDKDSKQTSIKS